MTRALTAKSVLLALAALTLPSGAQETYSPGSTAPLLISTGLAHHPAPTEDIDPQGTRRTHSELPEALELEWRASVTSGIAQGLAVAADGTVNFATPGGRIAQVSPEGRSNWEHDLLGPPTSPVAINSDGTRVVASSSGWVEGFDAHGRRRFRTRTGWAQPEHDVALLPLRDGSVVAASVKQLLWLERDGRLRAATNVGESILVLRAAGPALLAVGHRGTVFRWDGQRAAENIGSFHGEIPRAPAVVSEGMLVALMSTGVYEKDARTGRVGAWATSLTQDVPSALALTAPREVSWLSSDNFLFQATASGRLRRIALGPQTTSAPFPLAPLADGRGRLVLLNALSELVVVEPSGQVRRYEGARCPRPLALMPLAPAKVLLACETGVLFAFREPKAAAEGTDGASGPTLR